MRTGIRPFLHGKSKRRCNGTFVAAYEGECTITAASGSIAILNLSTFPQSHQERNEGRYAEKGYRQLLIDNYIAIFRIDEVDKIVYVVTIQYQGRKL